MITNKCSRSGYYYQVELGKALLDGLSLVRL